MKDVFGGFLLNTNMNHNFFNVQIRANNIYSTRMRVNNIYSTRTRVNDIYSTRMRADIYSTQTRLNEKRQNQRELSFITANDQYHHPIIGWPFVVTE